MGHPPLGWLVGLWGGPVRGDGYGEGRAGGVVGGAGPGVVRGGFGEASGDRVAVDIAKLFEALLFGVDVEVVAREPEGFAGGFEEFGGLLFEDFEGGGQVGFGGFGEEEADVLRHEDVRVDVYAVFLSGFFEDVFEGLLGVVLEEVREAVVAAEVMKWRFPVWWKRFRPWGMLGG